MRQRDKGRPQFPLPPSDSESGLDPALEQDESKQINWVRHPLTQNMTNISTHDRGRTAIPTEDASRVGTRKNMRPSPNVVHLCILPTLLDRLLRLLHLLPALLRNKLQSWWPEWFLPPEIVLKRQKIGWDEEFDNEIAIYRRLAPVQGTIVPVCYGEAVCPATETTGTRALVLSDIGGIDLNEAGGLGTYRVKSMLMDSLLALANLGVSHDDSKLDNYRFVGDRIMVIDFDSSYIIENDDRQYIADLQARFGTRQYWLVHGGEKPKYQ